ncbi:hypothetical protein ABLN72_11675, partial [Mycobacterium tuberculosis]
CTSFNLSGGWCNTTSIPNTSTVFRIYRRNAFAFFCARFMVSAPTVPIRDGCDYLRGQRLTPRW